MITVPMTVTKRIILNLESINSIFLLDESLLEPSVLKGTRWVLRRERRSNPPDLSDYSMENYINAINKYHVIAVIFPKQWFTLEKLEAQMSTSLDIFYDKTTLKDNKNLFLKLTTTLYDKLKNWKELKPTRGIIEDFFKVCKDAFGLGEFHSYTQSSMRRNIYLCILLSTLVIQQGFDTKTKLQQLAEGRIDLEPIKSRKSKKSKENNETTENQEVGEKTDEQTTLIIKKEEQSALDLFA